MAYSYDAGLIDRIKPRISQWEATTGRKISPSMLDSLIKGELSVESDKATKTRALDIQESQYATTLAAQQEQADKANKAAKVKGYADLGTTAATLGLTGYALSQPSSIDKYLLAQRAGQTQASQQALYNTGWPGSTAAPATYSGPMSATAPAYTSAAPGSLTAGTSGMEFGSAASGGAQATLGGGTTALGGQAALGGSFTGAGSLAYTGTAPATYGAGLEVGAGLGESAGAGIGLGAVAYPLAAASVGHALGAPVAKLLGTHEKTTKDVMGTAAGAGVGAYLAAGTAIGGPVGAFIGGVVGLGISVVEDVSVVCSELLRQGKITEQDRTKCVVFRFRNIPDDMFEAYLEWARPIVAAMRRKGALNALLLPFAQSFIGYMISVQDGRKPTFTERMVWKYAWSRCKKIAHKNVAVELEVAA